ncbi:MAG: YadA-like family protein, partial [Pseudorhodoplanes sp.]
NNTYTMRGIASDASRAAQQGPVELVTSDANGNLATDGGRIFDELDDLEEGVAMAMALPGVGFLPDGKAGAVNASFGAYKGSFAVAGSAAFKLNENIQLDGGVAIGLDSGDIGGRGGVTFAW